MKLWEELKVNGVDLTHSPLNEYRDVFFHAEKGVREITSTQKSVVESELKALGVGNPDGWYAYRPAFNDRDGSRLKHYPAQVTYFTDTYGKPMRLTEARKKIKI